MEIFKQLKKLGYKHYIDSTIEELDSLPINNIKKRIEYSLVVDFLREKYNLHITISCIRCHADVHDIIGFRYEIEGNYFVDTDDTFATYYEAREKAILKCIELCKNKK